jgi:tRNA pseudouridine13 synthase
MDIRNLEIRKFLDQEVENKDVVIKERYEDFVVREITKRGMCVEKPRINIEHIKEVEDYLGRLGFTIPSDMNPKENSDICVITEEDKEKRGDIHLLLKKHPLIFANTKDKSIYICHGDDGKSIFRCILRKVNRDTMDSCRTISSLLSIPFKNVNFAGNKDKRGITYQEISIKGVRFSSLFDLADRLERENGSLKIYDIYKSNKDIRLGELEGNRFGIKIRGNMKMVNRLENGFVNYYGYQRFGNNMNNHEVGRYLLEKDYKACVDLIMNSNKREDLSAAKEMYLNGEYAKSHSLFPSRFVAEKCICKGKMKGSNDKSIMMSLPRELRMLYLHSYQSFIFNRMVNERLEKGNEVIEGDLVIESGEVLKVDGKNLAKYAIHDVVIPLVKMEDKMLKGGYRKIVEVPKDVSYLKEDDGMLVEFTLSPSSYATMAIRELIGDSVYFNWSTKGAHSEQCVINTAL